MTRLVLLTVAVALWSSNARAAAPPTKPDRPPAKSEGAPKPKKLGIAAYVDRIDKGIGLTSDQKQAITAILEARDKSLAQFQDQHGDQVKAAALAVAKANADLTEPMNAYLEALGQQEEGDVKPAKPRNEQQVRAAKRALDKAREAVAKANREYREACAPMHQIVKKANDELLNTLTPAQQQKFNSLFGPKPKTKPNAGERSGKNKRIP